MAFLWEGAHCPHCLFGVGVGSIDNSKWGFTERYKRERGADVLRFAIRDATAPIRQDGKCCIAIFPAGAAFTSAMASSPSPKGLDQGEVLLD